MSLPFNLEEHDVRLIGAALATLAAIYLAVQQGDQNTLAIFLAAIAGVVLPTTKVVKAVCDK